MDAGVDVGTCVLKLVILALCFSNPQVQLKHSILTMHVHEQILLQFLKGRPLPPPPYCRSYDIVAFHTWRLRRRRFFLLE